MTAPESSLRDGWFNKACRCPACGRTGLFLGKDGWPTCSQSDCPDPLALSDLLTSGREAS
jgi:hypothetical protein